VNIVRRTKTGDGAVGQGEKREHTGSMRPMNNAFRRDVPLATYATTYGYKGLEPLDVSSEAARCPERHRETGVTSSHSAADVMGLVAHEVGHGWSSSVRAASTARYTYREREQLAKVVSAWDARNPSDNTVARGEYLAASLARSLGFTS